MTRPFDRADSRPRIYLSRTDAGDARWSTHPNGFPHPAPTIGAALDLAIEQLGKEAARGVVAIVETTAPT